MVIRLDMRVLLRSTGSLYLHATHPLVTTSRSSWTGCLARNFRNEIDTAQPREQRSTQRNMTCCSALRPRRRVPYSIEPMERRGRGEGGHHDQHQVIRGDMEVPGRCEDWWPDIPALTNQKERMGYDAGR